jgi:hypothetical protein
MSSFGHFKTVNSIQFYNTGKVGRSYITIADNEVQKVYSLHLKHVPLSECADTTNHTTK